MYIDLGTHVITNDAYNFYITTLKEMLNVK